MPELPEVETMCRGIGAAVGGVVRSAQLPPCTRRPISLSPAIKTFSRRITGCRIAAIGRLGKRVLIHLDDGQTIAIEPRMSGIVLVARPPTEEHLRFRLLLDGAGVDEVLFWDRRGLGTVRLLTAGEMQALTSGGRIGPDALAIDEATLRLRLGSLRRPVKPALLDQKYVAGIGNLYAAEILHLAGVDPRARCDRLSGPQWQRIHAAIDAILSEAIRLEGSTLADGTYRSALNRDGSYQSRHRVYDREGHPCLRCGEPIRRIVQSGRSTFFCPGCQRRRGLHPAVITSP